MSIATGQFTIRDQDDYTVFRVVAKGNNATTCPISPGLYTSNSTLIKAGARSYTVSVWNRTNGQWDSHTTYDVYGSTANATSMANALNALDSSKIVVIYTSDEPKLNRLSGGLDAAMYRCGASRAFFGSTDFKTRSAYILVGIPDIGEGNGLELYQGSIDNDDAWVDTMFSINTGGGIQLGGVGSSISNVVTNFNNNNDRISTAPATPTIKTDGTAVDHTLNTDGSCDISFEWDFTGTGDAYNVDGFLVYVRQGVDNTVYAWDKPAEEQMFQLSYDKRVLILYGVPSNRYYSFAVQAYRIVDTDVNSAGVIKGALAKATGSGENPYLPSQNVAFSGNIIGTVNGVSATDVANAVTNFDSRNDRLSAIPANPTIATDGTAVDHVINTDGSCDISLEWGFTGTDDAHNIDGFLLFIYASTSNSAYTFGTSPASETVINMAPDRRAAILHGVASDKYYTFGIQAYRIVDPDIDASGILKSMIVKPSITEENPYRPSSSVAFNGDIIGTIKGTSAQHVSDAIKNFDTRNDRVSTIPADPTILTDGTAIDHVLNPDGSCNISFEWKYNNLFDASKCTSDVEIVSDTVNNVSTIVYKLDAVANADYEDFQTGQKYTIDRTKQYRIRFQAKWNTFPIFEFFVYDSVGTKLANPTVTWNSKPNADGSRYQYYEVVISGWPTGATTCEFFRWYYGNTDNTGVAYIANIELDNEPFGKYDIDGFLVIGHQSTSSAVYTFGSDPTNEFGYNIPAEKRAIAICGLPVDKYYTFGVRAYRIVDQDISPNGIIYSNLMKSTATGENPYQPATAPVFNGNIIGTIDGTPVATVISGSQDGGTAVQPGNGVQTDPTEKYIMSIDGNLLVKGSVTTERLLVQGLNKIVNPDGAQYTSHATAGHQFTDWNMYSISTTSYVKRELASFVDGSQVPVFTFYDTDAANQKWDYITSSDIIIDPTKLYILEGWIKRVDSNGYAYLGLELYDSNNIALSYGTYVANYVSPTGGQWAYYSGYLYPSKTKAKLTTTLDSYNATYLQLDDVTGFPSSGTSYIVDTGIPYTGVDTINKRLTGVSFWKATLTATYTPGTDTVVYLSTVTGLASTGTLYLSNNTYIKYSAVDTTNKKVTVSSYNVASQLAIGTTVTTMYNYGSGTIVGNRTTTNASSTSGTDFEIQSQYVSKVRVKVYGATASTPVATHYVTKLSFREVESTTISGSMINTGTLDANVVNVINLNASNITAGTMSFDRAKGGTLVLGGSGNGSGILQIQDASGAIVGTGDNTGFTVEGGSYFVNADGVKSQIVKRRNLIPGHALIPPGSALVGPPGNTGITGVYFFDDNNYPSWYMYGQPYTTDWYRDEGVDGHGYVVVDPTNYIQSMSVSATTSKTFYLSIYAKKVGAGISGLSTGTGIRLHLEAYDVNSNSVVIPDIDFTITSSWARYGKTITVPSNVTKFNVDIQGIGGWICACGIEVVYGSTPNLYDLEESVSRHIADDGYYSHKNLQGLQTVATNNLRVYQDGQVDGNLTLNIVYGKIGATNYVPMRLSGNYNSSTAWTFWSSAGWSPINCGMLTKTTGSFVIPHPNPEKYDTVDLRHCFVEAPTRGENIYRYEIVAQSDGETVETVLPDYWQYLNENPQVWVSPVRHFGNAYGEVDDTLTKLLVTCEKAGKYNVLLIGTRKDKDARNWFDAKGIEKFRDEEWI